MKIMMFSDMYGSVTTTFIKNDVDYVSRKHKLVYVVGSKGPEVKDLKLCHVPFVRSGFTEKMNWIFWKYDLRCSFRNRFYANKLREVISKERPDIIHCHFAYEALKLLENLDIQAGIPILVHFHGYDASQMLRKKSYVKAIKKNFKKLKVRPIVVSERMKRALTDAGIDTSKGYLLRYGIDTEKFKPHPGAKPDNGYIHMLQISSLVEKKGHEYTLKALSLFLNRTPEMEGRVKITFTGDGERKRFLLAMAAELGVMNNVEFVGNVDPNQAVELLRTANVFIHHSVTASNGDEEGIPNSIIEAMAMELPILSTYHAGIPELVTHGVNGFLCKERDVEEMARQMAEIIKWKKLPVNRLRVLQEYSSEKHNRQLEQIYGENMLNPGAQAGR
jgi:colanic acid/amylovoran biosynthesis glycosyltransferase